MRANNKPLRALPDFPEPAQSDKGILKSVAELTETVRTAHELMGSLETNLGPILRDDGNHSDGDEARKWVPPPGLTPLGANVACVKAMVDGLIVRLEDTLSRVEL